VTQRAGNSSGPQEGSLSPSRLLNQGEFGEHVTQCANYVRHGASAEIEKMVKAEALVGLDLVDIYALLVLEHLASIRIACDNSIRSIIEATVGNESMSNNHLSRVAGVSSTTVRNWKIAKSESLKDVQ
jgi:hypothetical protein